MQLEAAIAASLQECDPSKSSKSKSATVYTLEDDSDDDFETFESDHDDNDDSSDPPAAASAATATKSKSTNSEPSATTSSVEAAKSSSEDWRAYLGHENGLNFELVLRFPDGNRENISFPAESQLKVRGIELSDLVSITFIFFPGFILVPIIQRLLYERVRFDC